MLSKRFDIDSVKAMKKVGKAPTARVGQWHGKIKSYNLHHKRPIHQGGRVYDFNNIVIVTPRYHKEILNKEYHYGRGKK